MITTLLLTLALALFAPTMAYAAAFPPRIPGPTHFLAAVDSWSPAPTAAPQLPFDVFRRQQQPQGSNTCGFVSGNSGSAVTCPNPTAICATNKYYGVHGCCDNASAKSCIIPTTCVPFTALSTSPSTTTSIPTSSSDEELSVTSCTDSAQPSCYEWHFMYDRTTMTQHGCAASAFTSTAFRSLGMTTSSEKETVTVTALTPTSSSPAPEAFTSREGEGQSGGGVSKPSLGAIIGGTIGACIFVSFCAFVVFLAWRRCRKLHAREGAVQQQQHHPHASVEYNPLGFHSPEFPCSAYPSPVGTACVDEQKGWQHLGPVTRYPGIMAMGQPEMSIAEVDGRQRAVFEAPGNEKLRVAEAPS